MSSKLADSWEGPYKVIERVGAVNYRISKVEAVKHSKVVHVNCIKEYKERASVSRLDVVLEEPGCVRNVLSGECEGFVQGELERLLEEFGCVFSNKPGKHRRGENEYRHGGFPADLADAVFGAVRSERGSEEGNR